MRLDQDVLSKKPTIAVILIGCRDVPGTTPAAYRSRLEQLTSRLRKAGIRVVLCTPTSLGERRNANDKNDNKLEELAEVVRELAQSQEVPLADLRASFVEHWRLYNPKRNYCGDLTYDGTHLNQRGNDFVAEFMLGKFR